MSTPSPYPLLSPASVPSTNEPIHRLKVGCVHRLPFT